MEDHQILDLFFERSQEAIEQCSSRFGRYCYTIAKRILQNDSDAQECVNDTWLRAWNAIPPTRPERLAAYLGKIARNIALDRYEAAHTRKRGGGVVHVALDELNELASPVNPTQGEITSVINSFLRDESTERADIFVKRDWYLRSVEELAAEYGYSYTKVTSILFRMRTKLKERLEKEGLW
jgi:RNA polymerase sigma-70 factor (ECF subfamily)